MRDIFLSFSILFFILGFYLIFWRAPDNFPTEKIFLIEEGSSAKKVALVMKKENVVRSPALFSVLSGFFNKKGPLAGDYFFEKKLSVFEVARRVSRGYTNLAPIKITIPEGFTAIEIGREMESKLLRFEKEKFLAEANEGYLFPDTYFFLTTDGAEEALLSFRKNFEKKVSPLFSEMDSSGKTREDILIMASIIEEESNGEEDRSLISGVLWKRLSIGMPLQVDVWPESYKRKGLPEKPISNPGISSIKASIHPLSSPYLYYLHDKDGVAHFAKSFAEHNANIKKYLK